MSAGWQGNSESESDRDKDGLGAEWRQGKRIYEVERAGGNGWKGWKDTYTRDPPCHPGTLDLWQFRTGKYLKQQELFRPRRSEHAAHCRGDSGEWLSDGCSRGSAVSEFWIKEGLLFGVYQGEWGQPASGSSGRTAASARTPSVPGGLADALLWLPGVGTSEWKTP